MLSVLLSLVTPDYVDFIFNRIIARENLRPSPGLEVKVLRRTSSAIAFASLETFDYNICYISTLWEIDIKLRDLEIIFSTLKRKLRIPLLARESERSLTVRGSSSLQKSTSHEKYSWTLNSVASVVAGMIYPLHWNYYEIIIVNDQKTLAQ